MGKALDGVKILDFTHVQSGPTCTQLLAWFGADVIKVERAGEGDITRGQLRDIPGVDSLYFTMLNHNKRSITVDAKNPKGKAILERDFTTHFSIDLMHKDLSLFLDNAAAHKVPTPTAASLRETYNLARATGHGEQDIAAVITAFEDLVGTKVS